MGWPHYRSLVSYAFRGSRTGQEPISLVPNWLRRNPILLKNTTTPFVAVIPYAQKPVSSKPYSTICVNSFLRRLYNVDKNNVHHFKSRGLKWWIRHPMDVITIASVGSLGCVLYITNLETVPYTNRRRVILLPGRFERWIGEWWFELHKSGKYEGKILPSSHPDDVRVQKIAKDIIEATHGALRVDRHRGAQTTHMEKFKWEVVVVDDPINNACCYPGGKIVVNTGLLRASESDDEIAATIGHEVAHAVARHSANSFSLLQLEIFILEKFMSALAFDISYHFLWHSLSRRCEREADYIGLLLSASAGYDPQAAPQMWERLAKTETRLGFREYLTTHPPYEERAQLLSDPKVMEEALSLYREALSQRKKKLGRRFLNFSIL